jgi:GNAT superfamily N-acetyltransferase
MASGADVEALATLRWTWRAEERGEEGMSQKEFATRFARWVADHRGTHQGFITSVDSTAVGMAWLATVERVPGPGVWRRLAGNLQSVYVLPDHRGGGLGADLVTAVLDEAVQRGLDYVYVHPSERSFSLYRRAGFREAGGALEIDLRSLVRSD